MRGNGEGTSAEGVCWIGLFFALSVAAGVAVLVGVVVAVVIMLEVDIGVAERASWGFSSCVAGSTSLTGGWCCSEGEAASGSIAAVVVDVVVVVVLAVVVVVLDEVAAGAAAAAVAEEVVLLETEGASCKLVRLPSRSAEFRAPTASCGFGSEGDGWRWRRPCWSRPKIADWLLLLAPLSLLT
jgi:hypothetical protein